MKFSVFVLLGSSLVASSFAQFAPTTFSYTLSSTHFATQSQSEASGQTGSLTANWQSGPDGAGVAAGSIQKRNGGHFKGEIASYTELSSTKMGPATVRTNAFANMLQEFQLTGTGAVMGFEGGINPTPEFSGLGRIRTVGSVGFTIRKRSGSNWNLFATRGRSIDLSNGSTITDTENLDGVSLTPGDYRIETVFSAYTESKWTGVGYGEGLIDYNFAYFMEELDGQVFSNTTMLLSNPVPEPATCFGLLAGIAVLGRKRRSKNL